MRKMSEKAESGTVLAVCVSREKGTQKQNVGSAHFIEDFGIEGDAHAGKWHRQVSLLSGEKIDAFRAKGAEVEDGAFGENLVVEGIDFAKLPVGTRFRCGEVVLELTQIGKECHNGCAIFQKMGECIMPREGVFTRVLKGGKVSVGDEMTVDKAMIFDTHAHYDDDAFNEDREQLLAALPEQGIARVVDVGASLASCRKVLELMERYDYIYGAIGVHPSETAELNEETYSWLKEQCQKEKCLAVGEIGLDYYWPEPDHETQKKWFLRQLDLAREIKKPVIIHSREAAKDTVDLMTEAHAEEIGGVIHCYSYTKETAKTFLDMGFYFGIGGVLTFKNAKKLKEAVEYIPMDRIVLETDCPYLAPEPNRGKRNSSLNIPYVIAAMAQIKEITEEEVRKAAWDNSLKLYRMDK